MDEKKYWVGFNLIKGIGVFAGLESLDVPGATGYFDTNYEGKAAYTLEAITKRDFVYVHVEAPDEAGHLGDPRKKLECIEIFDQKIVGPIMKGMEGFERYNILVMPDHPTPVVLRTHAADPIPYAIYRSDRKVENGGIAGFDEGAEALVA